MDSFEINKIVAAILLVALLVIGIDKVSEVVFHVEKPQTPGYTVEIEQVASSSTSVAEEKVDIAALMGMGDATSGEKIFKKCAACHSIVKGGANKIGPALWGVLGRSIGSAPDYKYSKAMASYGKNWSFEEMDGFLIKPKEWIKGTKMAFAGLKNAKDRAAVILYMNENTNSPLPIQ